MNMKRTHCIAVLAGLLAVSVLAADAHAMYNPATGTFLSRDPGPKADSPMRAGTGERVAGNKFIPPDPYVDGMNLYQYVRSNAVNRFDPFGLISLDEVVRSAIAHRPAGTHENYTVGLMVCLLWKESSFNEKAGNADSSAKGIAQLLEGTADDIQDRVGPKIFGLPKEGSFDTLDPGQRLKDHRLEVGPSIYAAYMYLEDRRLARGGDWEAGVKAYGPNGDKVIKCSKCCAIMELNDDFTVKNSEEVWKCLKEIHK
jgi:hypothetical protein